MENAWLDSLSEDWISQPRSEGSPAVSLPSLAQSTASSVSFNERAASSRIPVLAPRKQSFQKDNDDGNLPLSERSLNDSNIQLSHGGPGHSPKLRLDLAHGSRGRRLSRTVSASTASSVQHHTVQHKSLSTSPQKLRHAIETPEWKRRLLQGDVAYGEQRDLFSPAGLENIFRPPLPQQSKSPVPTKPLSEERSIIMPSSPPPYNKENQTRGVSSLTAVVNPNTVEPEAKESRAMTYKLADTSADQFSDNDLSRSSSFRQLRSKSQNANSIASSDQLNQEVNFSTKFNTQYTNPERTVSGQSDIRHEDLSPIFISRQSTFNGSIDYVALDLPTSKLQQRLQDLRVDDAAESYECQPEMLRESVANNTDDFAHNGRFVNLGRGGHSEEGSFQRRMLSSSSLPPIDDSAMLQEESVQASTPKQLPHIRKIRASDKHEQLFTPSASPAMPNVPHPSPTKDASPNTKAVSGSPLKLFGTYDTFTNQKLLRRLSQFEESLPDENSQDSVHNSKSGVSVAESINYTEMNEAYIAPSSPLKNFQENQMASRPRNSARLNTFGEGNLDLFEFSEQASLTSNERKIEDRENASIGLATNGSRKSFNFHMRPSATHYNGPVHQRSSRFTASATRQSSVTLRNRQESVTSEPTVNTPLKHYGENESKRLPHSPLKDPTPKRRRTLHRTDFSDIASSEQVLNSVRESHQNMQSVISKKRKDARQGDNLQSADPEVMASRQILRPRNPTPTQRSARDYGESPADVSNSASVRRAQLERQEKIARIQAELDAPAALLKTSAGIGLSMHDESRKGSVTTQDFLDEAKKIMAGIRGKARRSGLNSVEESESDNDKQGPTVMGFDEQERDDSFQESTKEAFSRPPSRDGGPVLRLPQMQQDPEVLSHLRKYEEMSDLDGLIASSMKSIELAREAVNEAHEIDRLADETVSKASSRKLNLDQAYQSDPPNIQITEYPELQRKRKHSTSSILATAYEHHEAEFPSNGSNSSSGQSTGRSIPTGSSRGSESKRVIAAHSVAHLIPEQLAGMIFDRDKRIWVKRKVGIGEEDSKIILPSDDDDPFGDIPDLTVDETQELQRMKAVAARQKEEARNSEVQEYSSKYREDNHQPDLSSSPVEMSGLENVQSSQPSASTRLASGTTNQDTRLTSWEDDQSVVTKVMQSMHHIQNTAVSEIQKEVEEFEEEILIQESRTGPGKSTPRRRNVTISFSSPIASIIEPEDYHNGSASDIDNSFHENTVHITQHENPRHYGTKTHSSLRTSSQRMSLRGHIFATRPVSRIEEREEGSILADVASNYQRSVSIVVSTPIPKRNPSQEVVPITPGSISIMGLTPLSDFTMNQHDDSFGFEVSVIGTQHRHQAPSSGLRTLSLYVKDIVKSITDVEPYEPFWEHIKQIDLRSKGLQSLHTLSRFCGVLQDLDVSDNQIGQLDGAPDTIRHLRVANNLLSDLSSWYHLRNLQYVDVSNNQLTTLDGLKDLIHLRSLRADNNRISSLGGVMHLDGLISLRLRDNVLDSVDFEGTSLQRLTDLDLKGNSIQGVRNLQELHSLTTLNLEDNQLLTFRRENREVMWALKYLKLGGNMLDTIDVSLYPNLRLLYLDRNRLVRVNGLLKAKHLDSLSLREQQEGYLMEPAFLNEAFEVRKLFLSGNYLSEFAPAVDFLNLQYLELANCGLESLPIEFGQMMSNIRVLNLNSNALRDIKPLLGIVRLKRLHLAGNRLFRLRKTANVLAQFSHLSKIDLRNNPLTLGFYPPVTEKRIVVHAAADEEIEANIMDHFALEDVDREKDTAYAGRLDMETRLRRRVFEMLMLGGCLRLRMLDGLKVNRTSLQIKDKVWDELARVGLVGGSSQESGSSAPEEDSSGKVAMVDEANMAEAKEQEPEVEVRDTARPEDRSDTVVSSERWGAEDSFA